MGYTLADRSNLILEKKGNLLMQDSQPGEKPTTELLRDAVADVFSVQDVTVNRIPKKDEYSVRLRGQLLVEAERAYRSIGPRCRELGYTAFLKREDDMDVIMAMPGVIEVKPSKVWINVVLFIATVLSTLLIGAMWAGEDPLTNPLAGAPFAASLMGILLTHELGHYLAARYYGVAATLPYFIPMPIPINPLGTFGAFISMKEPVTNRRALLAIGAAGPLAGFVLAIPILILGLSLSTVEPLPTTLPPGQQIVMEGNSILYLGLKYLMFGRILPANGIDVTLHPVAFAGWAGLLVTALNLLPAGQLDGGHIVYALLGERARQLTWVIILALAGLGLFWNGWLLWAALVFFLGRRHAVLLDDVTALDGPRKIIAIAVVILFLLIFTPMPLTILDIPPAG